MSNVNSVLEGIISALYVYPVKSCAGVKTSHVTVCETGFMFDREWMVVDTNGHFLTQRAHPRMALIQPHLNAVEVDGLTLSAPGMDGFTLIAPISPAPLVVKVWRDSVSASDMGDQAAEWLSDFLGTACRLVRFDKRERRICDPEWTRNNDTTTYFADGFPLLVLSAAAIVQLNRRMSEAGRPTVDASRFRPNIVVSDWPAHLEDEVSGFVAPDVALRFVKPCTRCAIPDIDPLTGLVTNRVNDILRDYRRNAQMNGALTFGMNAVITHGLSEILKTGQVVYSCSKV
jgi:uncharacterized protein YcbX